jgi:hypothetical protein
MKTKTTGSEDGAPALPLPSPRCLSRDQAAAYLGIGVTLLASLTVRPVRVGRRLLYDRVDLDAWLDEHKGRGRAIEEVLWPEDEDSTDGKTHPSGGSTWSSRMDAEYAKALGFGSSTKRRSV